MHDPQWKITGRQKESELHWLSLQMSVKDVPLWINRLVIGPMVGQTAALRLANRLASPLYYCVVKDTHIYMHTHTELSCRLAHMHGRGYVLPLQQSKQASKRNCGGLCMKEKYFKGVE